MTEETCSRFSSRGLLKSCDHHDPDPRSSQYIQERIDFTKVRRGDIVYVCVTAMRAFLIHQLPLISEPFILVTGDGDEVVPFDQFGEMREILEFLNSPKLIHWFAVNCVVDHPKLTRIPYGLDYHTCSKENPWGPVLSPGAQEALLDSIAAAAQPFWLRSPKIYWNIFAIKERRFGGDREEALAAIPGHLLWREEAQVPREDTWRKQTEFAFVASPHSNGLDCIRTWEALHLGCIPIVKTSPIDGVYDGLPVLIVKDWSDITEELLQKTVAEFRSRTWELERLTLAFWLNLIRAAAK